MRRSGLILHPTSLPGPEGIGTLGKFAHQWLDTLAAANQRVWQILPLGPTGFGDSPYMATSAFGSNPMLIDLDDLVERGWAPASYKSSGNPTNERVVDFDAVRNLKLPALAECGEFFHGHANAQDKAGFSAFCEAQAHWLDDFALFTALDRTRDEGSWQHWPMPLVLRQAEAMSEARAELAPAIEQVCFEQFAFWSQWNALRDHARRVDVEILGDVPIFVALHSSDVWGNPGGFILDENRTPTVVSGVPPDYFSETGQKWGNPLYDWNAMREQGYQWWIDRFRATMESVDWVRIDHFRGFESYWEVPADAETAINGRWVKGPGREVFDAIRNTVGALPVLAEDLGIITEEVNQLREALGFPGMRVLHFAFDGDSNNPHAPHNVPENAMLYTGTHDNDTTVGWYNAADDGERHRVRSYLETDGEDIAWTLIQTAWASRADWAIAPVQDVLRLGTEDRMNTPGTTDNNWNWRMRADGMGGSWVSDLAELTRRHGR